MRSELVNRLLKLLDVAGGTTTSYPFIEFGYVETLRLLIQEGLVEEISRRDDLSEIRITAKGRDVLREGQAG
jgi:hypothetical protein